MLASSKSAVMLVVFDGPVYTGWSGRNSTSRLIAPIQHFLAFPQLDEGVLLRSRHAPVGLELQAARLLPHRLCPLRELLRPLLSCSLAVCRELNDDSNGCHVRP